MFLVCLEDDVVKAMKNPDTRGRVLDLEIRRLFPPFNIHSIITRGQWEETTMTDEELQEKLKLVNQSLKWNE